MMVQLPERHPWWVRYATSVLAAFLSTCVTWAFAENGLHMHSSLMMTGVVIGAWFGGMGPGLLALLLTIPGQIYLRDPIHAWSIQGKAGWAGFFLYLTNAFIVCMLFRKRYWQRAHTEVSPVAVTGGWMWKYDPADEGTVETHSPEFPSVSATRTLRLWLERVHPNDRKALEEQIQTALVSGRLTAKYRMVREDGEVRAVSMFGVRVEDQQTSEVYLVATCLEVGAHDYREAAEWDGVPLG